MTDIEAKIVTITPAYAAKLLRDSAHHNRPLNTRMVDVYARDMAAGHWVINGQAIVLSPNGELLDGQHRLHAVVKSGVTIDTVISLGVPVKHFKTIDRGKERTFADVLHINGYHSTHRLAAITQVYIQIIIDNTQQFDSRPKVRTMDEFQAFFLEHEGDLIYASQKVHATRAWMASGIFGALIIQARHLDAPAAEDFTYALSQGANLTPDDPVLHLRNHLFVRSSVLGKDSVRRSRTEQYYLGALAWNFRRLQRSGRGLKRAAGMALGHGKRPELI